MHRYSEDDLAKARELTNTELVAVHQEVLDLKDVFEAVMQERGLIQKDHQRGVRGQ